MDASTSDRTLLQFSLRSMLVFTTIVAVLSAIVAPLVRRLNPDQQLELGLFLAVSLLLVGLTLFALCRGRWKTEKRSGRLLLRVPPPGSLWYHVGIAFVGCMILFSWVEEFGKMLLTEEISLSLLIMRQPFFLICFGVYYIVLMWWWRLPPGTIEAREKGIILSGQAFMPWSDMKSHRWGGVSPYHLTIQFPYRVVNLRVPPKHKKAFDRLLTERIGAPGSVEVDTE